MQLSTNDITSSIPESSGIALRASDLTFKPSFHGIEMI
jgi:hypothetical protein